MAKAMATSGVGGELAAATVYAIAKAGDVASQTCGGGRVGGRRQHRAACASPTRARFLPPTRQSSAARLRHPARRETRGHGFQEVFLERRRRLASAEGRARTDEYAFIESIRGLDARRGQPGRQEPVCVSPRPASLARSCVESSAGSQRRSSSSRTSCEPARSDRPAA
jgi:hypothetical protein